MQNEEREHYPDMSQEEGETLEKMLYFFSEALKCQFASLNQRSWHFLAVN